MNDNDWNFAIGSYGDPLADIKDWMVPPCPQWLKNELEKSDSERVE